MVRRAPILAHTARQHGVANRRRGLLLGPLAAAALLLAACGSDDAGTVATTVAAPEQAATGSAGAVEPAPTEGKMAADSTMMALQPVDYVYEGEMPALDGPAAAWRWSADRVPTPEQIQAVAAALGIDGEIVEQPADMGGGWAIGGETGHRLWVNRDAQGSWSYNGAAQAVCVDETTVDGGGKVDAQPGPPIKEDVQPAVEGESTPGAGPDAVNPPDSAGGGPSIPVVVNEPTTTMVPTPVAPPPTSCVPPVGVPTAAEAKIKAIELFQALGLDPDDYEMTADAQAWGAWVDARLLVDGIAAPAVTSFGFGPEGALTYASGQLFAPEQADQYERIGTAAALEQLRADQFRSYSPEVDPAAVDAVPLPAPADTPAEGGADGSTASPVQPDTPVSAPPATALDPGAPVTTLGTQEPVIVTLTGVDVGWWMVWADDGTVWLMPGYEFTMADGGEISAPAVAQIDMPVVHTMTGAAEPAADTGQ